jgi:hypothetical protein
VRDEAFRDLVMAQIIAPTSVLEWVRVLTGTGVAPFGTLKRRLLVLCGQPWR